MTAKPICPTAPIRSNGQAAADANGLGATDVYALNLLGALGPLTAGDLADRTGLTSGAATRLIDRLERRGYVERATDPADRRRVKVALVTGQDTGNVRTIRAAREQLAEVFERYDADELAVLFDFFGRADAAFRRSTDEQPAAPAQARR